MRRLILASGSPRRREILSDAGYAFDVEPADSEEVHVEGMPHAELAIALALGKAREVAARHMGEDAVVLGADTFISFRGRILGKPRDSMDARAMLGELSGSHHQVITGYALIDTQAGLETTGAAVTDVLLRTLSHDEINAYVATGEPLDKAGAYGIQGRGGALVDRLDGSFLNVVGLPLESLRDALAALGIQHAPC